MSGLTVPQLVRGDLTSRLTVRRRIDAAITHLCKAARLLMVSLRVPVAFDYEYGQKVNEAIRELTLVRSALCDLRLTTYSRPSCRTIPSDPGSLVQGLLDNERDSAMERLYEAGVLK